MSQVPTWAWTEAPVNCLEAHCPFTRTHTGVVWPQFSLYMYILTPAIHVWGKIVSYTNECFHPLTNCQVLSAFMLKSQPSSPSWQGCMSAGSHLLSGLLGYVLVTLSVSPFNSLVRILALRNLHSQLYFQWILSPWTSVQLLHWDLHFIGRLLLTKLVKSRPLHTLPYLLS